MPKRLIIDGFSGFSSVAPSDPAEIDATRQKFSLIRNLFAEWNVGVGHRLFLAAD
jgi:hypothetical protein